MKKLLPLLAANVALGGCASSDAQIVALEKSLRALESRLARAESSDQTLNDKLFVVSAQVEECRAEVETLAGGPVSRPESIAGAGGADDLYDPTLPKHLQLVSLEPEPAEDDPIVLELHGGPEALDVTDVPPPPRLPDPAVARADFDRGLDAYRDGKFEQARTAFESFVDTHPVHQKADNAMYWVGECSYELGDYSDALTAFRRIVNEYPKSRKVPDAMFKIGTSYEQLSDGRNARRAFERLVKRYPDSAYAELARARLQ